MVHGIVQFRTLSGEYKNAHGTGGKTSGRRESETEGDGEMKEFDPVSMHTKMHNSTSRTVTK